MTLTIDLTSTEQARLDAAARQQGMDSATLLKKLVNNLPPASEDAGREQTRVDAIHAARGSLAHIGATVDDLHRNRQADRENEERQAQRPQ